MQNSEPSKGGNKPNSQARKIYMRKSTENLMRLGQAPGWPDHTQQPEIPLRGKKSSLLSAICRPLLLAVLIASLKTEAQEAPPSREIRVGDRAPSFTLKDQNDRE